MPRRCRPPPSDRVSVPPEPRPTALEAALIDRAAAAGSRPPPGRASPCCRSSASPGPGRCRPGRQWHGWCPARSHRRRTVRAPRSGWRPWCCRHPGRGERICEAWPKHKSTPVDTPLFLGHLLSQRSLTSKEEDPMETSKTTRQLSIAAALLFAATAMTAGYRTIGLPPVVIVGGSALIGLVLWIRTYLRRPLDPHVMLPPFLLTVAALEVHMAEEYLTGFGPAMSRLFDISWTEHS